MHRRLKLTLIFPALPELRAQPGRPPIGDKIIRFPPLGLMMVAGATPDNVDITLVDEHVDPVDFTDDADIIGISSSTALAPRSYEICDEFRRRRGNDVVLALGGFHPTFYPDEALQHCDVVFVGEATSTWPLFVELVRAQKPFERVYMHDNHKPIQGLPFARRDLVKHNKRHYGTINMIRATHGCPFKCNYCAVISYFGHTYQMRPPHEVAAEMRQLEGDMALFADDNIIGNPSYAKTLFKELGKVGKSWMSEASINLALDDDLLKAAADGGMIGTFIGFETINSVALSQSVKKQNLAPRSTLYQKYEKALSNLHKAGIAVEAGVVFGFDADTPDIFEKTVKFWNGIGLDVMQVTALTPFPGTPVFDDLTAEGRIIDTNWEHYDTIEVVYQPKQMSPEELRQGCDWVRNQYYTLPKMAKRILGNLKVGLKPILGYSAPVNWAYYNNHRKGLTYPP